MTDSHHPPDQPTPEDRLVLDLVEELEPRTGAAAEGSGERLRREYLETLGMLAYAAEPAVPSAGLKRRILASISPPAPSATGGELPTASFRPPGAAAPARTPAWALALAAALALALVGFSGWQFVQLVGQGKEIARLTADLEALAGERADLAQMRARLAESRARVAMLASPGAEYCLLKPAVGDEAAADAWGVFVVASDRGRWFLRVAGLAPCAQGRTYRLWLVTDEAVVHAATFDGHPDAASIELTDDEVPRDIRAVAITLESGEPAGPTGPRVLYADRAMRLL